MLAYMNSEALKLTLKGPDIWFYSRSRKKLWEKGEKSGNYLKLISLSLDCDKDTILIRAIPKGPTCHKGNTSCFNEENKPVENTLNSIISIINERNKNKNQDSYTSKLLNRSVNAEPLPPIIRTILIPRLCAIVISSHTLSNLLSLGG